MLDSFVADARVVVIGASGGIGGAFVDALSADPGVGRIDACSRRPRASEASKVRHHALDLDDDGSLDALDAALAEGGPLDLVIVATGALHDGGDLVPEKSWRQVERAGLERAFALNTIGPALVAKRLVPRLRRDHKAVFAAVSARVGSIGDNGLGGWYAYRASKAALNQIIRTFAIELARRAPAAACIGLHPGTVATDLSAPFQASVPSGKLFTPAYAVDRLLGVIDGVGPADTGRLLAWDGEVIPY
ncbi:MAG: SDR family NAD(P)-dependent oxidoreductase [Pseudomonadota bacterium]